MDCRNQRRNGYVRMRILLDMNIPLKYAALFEEKGIKVLRWTDVGLPTATDTEIMEYARANNFIVMTCDLDFGTILSVTHELKPSVVQIRGSILHAEKAVDIIAIALLQNADDLNKGAILSIDSKNSRIRLLPL